MVDGAAAIAAKDAGCVGVVDHHDGAVFSTASHNPGRGADVSIHGEDAVGDEQLFAWFIFYAGEFFFGLGNVFVFVDENLGAG